MKFFSIDIETTGLDPTADQVLEIGVVAFTGGEPATWPTLRLVLLHERITGHPAALAMNAGLVQEIQRLQPGRDESPTLPACYPDRAADHVCQFLVQHLGRPPWTVAGKNVAGFDLPFLRRLNRWQPWWTRHRVLDPGSMYARDEDHVPPDLSECLERAGLVATGLHTAVGDAMDVARLVSEFFNQRKGVVA